MYKSVHITWGWKREEKKNPLMYFPFSKLNNHSRNNNCHHIHINHNNESTMLTSCKSLRKMLIRFLLLFQFAWTRQQMAPRRSQRATRTRMDADIAPRARATRHLEKRGSEDRLFKLQLCTISFFLVCSSINWQQRMQMLWLRLAQLGALWISSSPQTVTVLCEP